MDYEAIDFKDILGTKGLSNELLTNHFKLYEGYVKNANALIGRLKELVSENKTDTPEFTELKRRFGWEFNGVRLHEYYFENITKSPRSINEKSEIFVKIVEDFGSFEAWQKDFLATGKIRGIGWVVLYYDYFVDRLFNVWIGEHNINHLVGCEPILVMDCWEHAYMLDYQIDRAAYLESFFKAIDWQVIEDRFGTEQIVCE